MPVPVQDLTLESFAPFGSVVQKPDRATDASGPGWNWWGEMLQLQGSRPEDGRRYALGYLDLAPAPLQFDWAERHMLSDELLVPLTDDCLVYVGPADYPNEPDRLTDLNRFQVFRVRQGQAVLLKPGVWHGAPLAVDKPTQVLVLLLHNTSRQDGYVCRFEDQPVVIQV